MLVGSVGAEVATEVVIPPPALLIDEQEENSEVLPFGAVAVAVTTVAPTGTLNGPGANGALPLPSVATDAAPTDVAPSPLPDGSQEGLA